MRKVIDSIYERPFGWVMGSLLAVYCAAGVTELSVDGYLNVLVAPLLALFFAIVAYWLHKLGHTDWLLYFFVIIQPIIDFRLELFGPLKIAQFIFLLVAASLVVSVYQKKRVLRFGRLLLPLILLASVLMITSALNLAEVNSFERLIAVVFFIIFVFVALNIVQTKKQLKMFLMSWGVSIVVLAAIGAVAAILQRFTGDPYPILLSTAFDKVFRIKSLTPNSNFFSALLIVPLAGSLAYYLSARAFIQKRWKLVASWFLLAFLAAVLIVTYTRSAYAALIVLLVAFFFYEQNYKKGIYYAKMVLFGLSLVSMMFIIQPDSVKNVVTRLPNAGISPQAKYEIAQNLDLSFNRYLPPENLVVFTVNEDNKDQEIDPDEEGVRDIADESVGVRELYWNVGFGMIEDHPLIGVGPGNYGYLFEEYLGAPYFAEKPDPHNIYIEIMAEYGVLALVALLYLLYRGLWIVRQKFVFAAGEDRMILCVLAFSLVASLVQFAFLGGLNIMNIWLILAAIGVFEFLPQRSKPKKNTAK